MREALSFDDVLLVPQHSEATSRKEICISSTLKLLGEFSLPVISSPMDTVTEVDMASAMFEHGGVGIVHRYNTIDDQLNTCSEVLYRNIHSKVGAAIGVTGDYKERAAALFGIGVDLLCIDIAHGHHKMMHDALQHLREKYDNKIHVMAGNVATLEGFNDLADWGADSIRVGIGGGSICSTRLVTGHGMPTLQSIMDCAVSDRDAKLIADGGMKTSGDVVKALAAGADFVMLGSMLAGTSETPGAVIENSDGQCSKFYRGMASKDAQINWRGKSSTPEGVATTIPYRGPVGNILEDIRGGIQSGLSYSGVSSVSELQARGKWVRQSPAGQVESSTHILRS
jgi:IMP dehydrogenase